MKEKLKSFLLSNKGIGILNGLASVFALVAVARIHGAHGDRAIEMLMAFNAAMFAAIAAMRFSDHYYQPMLQAYRDIGDSTLEIIRDMREQLNEKDAEISRLKRELEETYS